MRGAPGRAQPDARRALPRHQALLGRRAQPGRAVRAGSAARSRPWCGRSWPGASTASTRPARPWQVVAAVADDRNLRAALAYAKAGWRVFPCIPGEKVPATSHGVKDATTDPAQIRAWWARNPGRNVAIATGCAGPGRAGRRPQPDGASGFPALRQLQSRRPDRRAARRAGPHPDRRRAPVFRAGAASRATAACRGHAHRLPQRRRLCGRPAPRSAGPRRQRGPTSWSATRPTRDPIDWAKVREHLEPQRERQWEPPAHLRDGGQQNLDHLVAHMAGPARGEPQPLPALGRQPGPRPRPGRAADRAGQRRRGGRAATAARPTGPSSPPGSTTPGPARHPPATRASPAGAPRDPAPASLRPARSPRSGRSHSAAAPRSWRWTATGRRSLSGPSPRARRRASRRPALSTTASGTGGRASPGASTGTRRSRRRAASEPSREEAAPPFCAGRGHEPEREAGE